MLKLNHRGEQIGHDIIRFKCGLNKDIATHLTLHKFDTVEGIFQAAVEIERELKERTSYKAKGQAFSGWPKGKEATSSITGWHKNKDQPTTTRQQAKAKVMQKYPPRQEAHKYPNPKGF